MSSSRAFTLHQTGLMNSVSERAFDNIAYLAKLIFNTDIVLISLIDDDQQWFKAKIGLSLCETPVDISICQLPFKATNPLLLMTRLLSRFVIPYIRFDEPFIILAKNLRSSAIWCT